MVFLVTSYSSVSPSAPPSLHNSVYFNAWFHISGSHLFMAAKPPQTGQGCDTAGALALGWVCLQRLFFCGKKNPPLLPPKQGGSSQAVGHVWTYKDTSVFNTSL